MNKSEAISNLAAALVKAQAKIEGATKDKTNPHFKSKYADLSSVVEAIKKPATDNGLTWTQVLHDGENCAKVETIILHQSGEWISCGTIAVPVTKQDAQGYGSALTYARRYSLSAAFGVAPEDDDGNAAAAAAPKAKTPIDMEKLDGRPNSGAGETLTNGQKEVVQRVASEIIDWFESGDATKAFETYAQATDGWDVDHKNFLWSFLSSAQRAAIKKAGSAKGKKATPQELATQA